MNALHGQTLYQEIAQEPSPFIKYLNYFTVAVAVVCYAVLLYLVIFHFELITLFFGQYQKLREFIIPGWRLPIYGIAMIFCIVTSLTPFAQVVPFTSLIAFFYGFWPGLLFGMAGFFASAFLTMTISRHLGKNMVKKVIGPKNWNKANILAGREGLIPFVIAYIFPVFPNAVVSWIAGITGVTILPLALAGTLAQIPGIIISVLVGSGIMTQNFYLAGGLFIALIFIAVILNTNRPRILKLIRPVLNRN
jgi:uncharacterized membrane protein YdjX (TVP38/TMEM64 family)